MESLGKMSLEELRALDENGVSELIHVHNIKLPRKERTLDNYLKCLEERWYDIQQDSADNNRYEDR